MALANFQNSLSTLAPASIDKSACIPAGIMSPGLGPAELLRNCLLDWAPSGANKKRPPGLGPGSFLKKLQWGAVFLCQIEYGAIVWKPLSCFDLQDLMIFSQTFPHKNKVRVFIPFYVSSVFNKNIVQATREGVRYRVSQPGD